MNYYQHPYVSNSDLSKLKKELQTPEIEYELKDAYRMGALVDAIITEFDKVDMYGLSLGEYSYYDHEMKLCSNMAKKFNSAYRDYIILSEGQKEFYVEDVEFTYEGTTYVLPGMRCKFDLYNPSVGTEIKTTVATTAAQFLNVINRLDYDRAAYIYMLLSGVKRFQIIGISKKAPHNLFHVPITIDSPLYKSGKRKAEELAFKYYMLKA